MNKKRKQKNKKPKKKLEKKATQMRLDPIGIVLDFLKKNWAKFLSFVIPFYGISTIVIKFTMLHIYNVPKEYILPMLKPSTWDLVNSFNLLLLLIFLVLIVELVMKIVRRKILRFVLYFSLSLICSSILAEVYGVGLFYIIVFFLACITGIFIYLVLIRSIYQKGKRDIAQKAFNLPNKNFKRYVFVHELCLMLGGYLVFLFFAANIGVMLPKVHTSIDGKIIISSSFDKYLVSDYTVEHTNAGVEYILINVNEMDIVKTGKIKKIDNLKVIIRGERF